MCTNQSGGEDLDFFDGFMLWASNIFKVSLWIMNRFIIEDSFDFDHSEFLTIYWFICQFDNLLDKFLSYKY